MVGKLEALDDEIAGLQEAEVGVLRMLGDRPDNPGQNGPSDLEPSGSGWATAARQINLPAGITSAKVTASSLMLAQVTPSPADPLHPQASAPFVEQGRDQRAGALYATLPRQRIGNELFISDWTASGRQVTNVGSGDGVERLPMSRDEKPRLSLNVTYADDVVKPVAVVIDGVPVKLVAAVEGCQAYLEAEGRCIITQTLDAHAAAAIQSAGPVSGQVGASLIEQTRHGVSVLRGLGFTPNVLALSPR